ncbi:hypothetical protein E2C01_062446 [Portunus trituberculatus]|uniref:Uncharacterized protein n=1 Tax=Portunus trituberculatus TaxID=210409 RepID=A0A5B7HHB5_PORTR|nr:hypothetical protein [Portunus trituberculatus]
MEEDEEKMRNRSGIGEGAKIYWHGKVRMNTRESPRGVKCGAARKVCPGQMFRQVSAQHLLTGA